MDFNPPTDWQREAGQDIAPELPEEAESRRQVLARWALIFFALNCYGLFSAQQTYFYTKLTGGEANYPQLLVLGFSSCWIWAAMTPGIVWLARHFRIERQAWLRMVLLHLVLAMLFHIIDISADIFIARTFLNLVFDFRPQFLLQFDYNVFYYFLALFITHAADYYGWFRERQLRAARLQTQLVSAQLQVLKMQIQPHFLFNTLHAISELVHEDPEVADHMITRLGDLLRLSLASSANQEVPLKQELEFLSAYLEIEQTRFRDRLKVSTSVDADTLDARVPNLLLQPIVENAIKHGTGPQQAPGFIHISATRLDGNLRLEVRDNGRGLPNGNNNVRVGVGLGNTRARLEQLYGGKQHFELRNGESGGAVATIVLPFRLYEEGK
jgi:two-component system LytT family sensor kinase